MKVNEILKKVEVSIEIPRFETCTDIEGVFNALSMISDAKDKLVFIKNTIPMLEKFLIEVGYDARGFAVNVYSTSIMFLFDRYWVTEKIPVTVTSNIDIAALQQEKWQEMSNKERACFAINCYIERLDELQTKYEEWLKFLESEADVQ